MTMHAPVPATLRLLPAASKPHQFVKIPQGGHHGIEQLRVHCSTLRYILYWGETRTVTRVQYANGQWYE